MRCLECGEDLTTKSVYKHALACFRLPDRGAETWVNETAGKDDERSRRIHAMMQAAREQ